MNVSDQASGRVRHGVVSEERRVTGRAVPVADRLNPRRTSVQYAIRRPLAGWLEATSFDGLRVVDVGCGSRPYEQLLAGAAEVVGFDVPGNPCADVHGAIDALPFENASFDVVLCTQVLEHVPDPAAAVRELRRIVRPGGRVLLSTHGVYPYHPNPVDLWRWTHEGLELLFEQNGPWRTVTVEAGAGTAATVAMLVARLVDWLFKRARMRPVGKPLIAILNSAGEALDRSVPVLRRQVPGSLNANFHVVAIA